jgi:hypothetical protein
MNRNAMSLTFHATPVMPVLLLPLAPITLATAVPWPVLSLGVPLPRVPRATVESMPLTSST